MSGIKDIRYFKKVRLDKFNYSICWPNGADFSPDVLYEKGVEIKTSRTTKKNKTASVLNSQKPTNQMVAKSKWGMAMQFLVGSRFSLCTLSFGSV